MTDKDVEQAGERADEPGYGPEPWWAGLGTWGAVGLIAFGGLVAVWVTFRLPGTPEELASGYHQAAKVTAVGLVIVGSALLTRWRARGAAVEETDEAERS